MPHCTSIRGTSWGRPDDKIGLAGAINAISRDHRDAIGGLGILIGDGQINYRPEKVRENFYAYNVNKWSTLTFDYQFIAYVAHNADRGPGISVLRAPACRVLARSPEHQSPHRQPTVPAIAVWRFWSSGACSSRSR